MTKNVNKWFSRNIWYLSFGLLAGVILLTSFIPRFFDIVKFLPYYSTDENEIVEFAIGYFRGDFDQRFYSYGPLMSYLMAMVYYIMALFSSLSIDEFAQQVFFDNTTLYYAARFINACIAIATGWVVFDIIRHLWNKQLAFFALPLLMFPFADFIVAFTARVDTLLGLFYALSILFMIKAFNEKATRNILLSAFFAGMSFACKPMPAMLLLPSLMLGFVFLHFKKTENNNTLNGKNTLFNSSKDNFIKHFINSILFVLKDKRFYLFLVVLVISAFLFFPHAFLNLRGPDGLLDQQFGRIAFESNKNSTSLGWKINIHLKVMGMIYVFTGLFGLFYGIVIALVRKNYKNIIVFILPIILLLAFSRVSARDYWYTPIVYFFAIGVVVVANEIFNFIRSEKYRWILGMFILSLMMLRPAASLVKQSKMMIPNSISAYEQINTEFAACKWIEENIPERTNIGMYGYYTLLPRLVDYDVDRQSFLGEYYMYYRNENKYFVEQFEKAYKKYVSNKENKTYQLTKQLNFKNNKGEQINFDLRYRNEKYEPYLFELLMKNKVDYFVTTHQQDESWTNRLTKSFKKKDYRYGREIFIYKIK